MIPKTIPMTPPIRQRMMASVINWMRIALLGAPSAFLVPISLVRSVMETIMMFITPIPPTSNAIPAIREIANVICPIDLLFSSIIDCML